MHQLPINLIIERLINGIHRHRIILVLQALYLYHTQIIQHRLFLINHFQSVRQQLLLDHLLLSTSFMIIPSGALAIGIAYTIYKKKKASKEAQV